MKGWIRLAILAALVGLPRTGVAQDTAGTVAGTTRDSSKALLPGVMVTVTGSAVMGTRTAVSDERGDYIVRALPPGIYDVRAEMTGFAAVLRHGVEVRVGQSATVDFALELAPMSETTEVRAASPVIDMRSTSRNFTVNSDAIALIPVGLSQQFGDLWVVAPGVRDSAATSATSQPSINGASGTQNKVLIDGIDVGDHVNAGTTTYLNQAVIQEAAISTGGFEASAGFASGGLMNIVTRSGGNALHAGASIFLTPKRWNDVNIPGTSPADVESYYPEAHVGGPIKHDRAWYFGTEKYTVENRGIFNVSAYREHVRGHEIYAKVTHQLSRRNRLAYIYQHDRRSDDPSFGTSSFAFDATPKGYFGGYLVGANWDAQVGHQGLLTVVGSYFDKPNTTNGRNGTNPRTQFANAAGTILVTDGNYDRDQTNGQTRPYITAALTQNYKGLGSHDVKLSTELYPRTQRLNTLRLNTIQVFRDSSDFGPRQLWKVQTPRPTGEVDNNTIDHGYAFGAQDFWRPTTKLTLNGGVRYESNRTIVDGVATPLLDYDSWSPRLGAAYQIDTRTVIKSSWSRMGEKFALDFAFSFFPNTVVYDTATSSKVNGEMDVFTNGGSTTQTTTQRNVSRPVPSVNEYVLTLERQLPGQVAVDVSYVQRRFGHFAESVDRNLILDIPGKQFVGRVDPNFDALIDVVDTNRVKRKYRTLQVWVNRRLANHWQFNGSYTYGFDKQDGEFGYFSTANAAQQFAYGDQASEYFATERGGRHNLKASGSYTLPADVTVGVFYEKQSDTVLLDTYQQFPAGTLAPRVTLSNGRVVSDPLFNPVLLVAPPRDQQGKHIGGTDLLNLQLQKTFRFGTQRFRVTAVAYNLPNAAARLSYASSLVGSANYNTLSGAQRPRAGQLSFGWEF